MVLSLTAPSRQVTTTAPIGDDTFALGATIDVEFPDGTVQPGTVVDVGNVAANTTGTPGDTPTVTITIGVDNIPATVDSFVEIPVTLRVVSASVPDAIVVPVSALARAQGGRLRGAGGDRFESRRHQPDHAGRRHDRPVHQRLRAGRGRPQGRHRRRRAVMTSSADQSVGRHPGLALELIDIVKEYPGEPPVRALDSRVARSARRRAGSDRRAVGLRQVDAAAHHRHARPTDQRHRPRRRRRHVGDERPSAVGRSLAPDRLRLPVVLPARGDDRGRQRRQRSAVPRQVVGRSTRCGRRSTPSRRARSAPRRTRRARCRVANVNAWRSPAPSSTGRRSCWPTNRPATSTPVRAAP